MEYRESDVCPADILDATWCKRLYLNGIKQIGNDKVINLFKFEYNTNNLPYRYSPEQDFWGYYNNNGAQSLIPRLYVYPDERVAHNRYRIYPIEHKTAIVLNGADRTPNSAAILSGTLEKIIFSTGGERVYGFESNEFRSFHKNLLGPGLRLASITHSDDPDPDNNIVRFYRYTSTLDDSTASSGKLYSLPIFGNETNFYRDPQYTIHNTHIRALLRSEDDAGLSEYDIWDRFTKRSSHPFNPTMDMLGNTIGYSRIEEIIPGNGKIERSFNAITNYFSQAPYVSDDVFGIYAGSGYDNVTHFPAWNFTPCTLEEGHPLWGAIRRRGPFIFPFPTAPVDYSTGNKRMEKVFREDGTLLQQEEFRYSLMNTNSEVISGVVYNYYDMLCNVANQGKYHFLWSRYDLTTNTESMLTHVERTVYDTESTTVSNVITEDIVYVPNRALRRSVERSYNDGVAERTIYRYPFDVYTFDTGIGPPQTTSVAVEGFYGWVRKNIISQPVEILHYHQPVGGAFKLINAKLVTPKKASAFNSATSASTYYPNLVYELETNIPAVGFENAHIDDMRFKKDDRYELYVDYTDYDDYGNLLKVRERNGLQTSYTYVHNGAFISTIIENQSSALERRLSYLHQPFVGIMSSTDYNNVDIHYEYDAFNRLLRIRDFENNIIEEFEYKHTNETSNELVASELIVNPSDRTASVDIIQGIGPFNYSWTIRQNNQVIHTSQVTNSSSQGDLLDFRSYTPDVCGPTTFDIECIVTDIEGNTVTKLATAVPFDDLYEPMTVLRSPIDINYDDREYEADIEISGGIAPYSYEWTFVQGTNTKSETNNSSALRNYFKFTLDLCGVSGFSITCRVTDACGKSIYHVLRDSETGGGLGVGSGISIDKEALTATMKVSGGSGPYNFTWITKQGPRTLTAGGSLGFTTISRVHTFKYGVRRFDPCISNEYQVICTVKDDCINTTNYTWNVIVENVYSTIAFEFEQYGNYRIEFNATGINCIPQDYQIRWEWGDGTQTITTPSSSAVVRKAYGVPGQFTVKMTVLDLNGNALAAPVISNVKSERDD